MAGSEAGNTLCHSAQLRGRKAWGSLRASLQTRGARGPWWGVGGGVGVRSMERGGRQIWSHPSAIRPVFAIRWHILGQINFSEPQLPPL